MDKKLTETELIDTKCCHTNCPVSSAIFHWKIQNFSFLNKKIDEYLESLVFSSPGINEMKFKLRLYPNGYNNLLKDSIGLFLYFIDRKYTNITIDCTLSIIKNDGSCYSKSYMKHNFPAGWGYENFIKRDDLLKPENQYLQQDVLHIMCKIKASIGEIEHCSQDLCDLDIQSVYKDLSEDLCVLMTNDRFSDICIQVDKVNFHVHKNILAARSSVFSAMLEHDMQENSKNIIQIPDFEPEVIKTMISYIYTGHVDDIDTKALELLKAADKYDLSRLKNLCEISLCKSLSADSVIKILYVADLHNLSQLKKEAINFIKMYL